MLQRLFSAYLGRGMVRFKRVNSNYYSHIGTPSSPWYIGAVFHNGTRLVDMNASYPIIQKSQKHSVRMLHASRMVV